MSTLFLAIDIGGTFTKVSLLEKERQSFREKFPTPESTYRPKAWWDALFASLLRVLPADMSWDSLSGIGITVPGLFDYRSSKMDHSPNLPVINKRNILTDSNQSLPEKLQSIPVMLMNDADAAGLGIAKAFGQNNCLIITLGTGCGGALILNGAVWVGETGYGSEFGHMTFSQDPTRKCKCGKVGCVETYLGEYGLIQTARELFPKKKLTEHYVGKALVEQVQQGDKDAEEVLLAYGRHIGQAISSVINLMGLHSFFLYGGISLGYNIFSPGIRKGLQDGKFAYAVRDISVRAVPHDKDYAAQGLYHRFISISS